MKQSKNIEKQPIVMSLLTEDQVMAQFGIKDKRTIRNFRRRKGLDFLKVGKQYRYTQEMIDRFVQNNSSLSIKNK